MRAWAILRVVLVLIACACTVASPTADTTNTSTPTPATPTSSVAESAIGSPSSSIGDPYYPGLGNGGYDVEHYTIELVFDPATRDLKAEVAVDAIATEDLSEFNLDFVGFTIDEVVVGGTDAAFVREDEELVLTPTTSVSTGDAFTVVIGYHGVPAPVDSVAHSVLFEVGWLTSEAGQEYVASEPNGAHSWFPSNDHPLDKATFTFEITLPDPLIAAANGTQREPVTHDGSTTWVWEHSSPMAPYLATLVIGEYQIVSDDVSSGMAGVPIRNVLPEDLAADPPLDLGLQGEMIAFFSQLFGPYPFDTYGTAVVDGFPHAVENQTLSLIGRDFVFEEVLAHEIAHQWFGNSVSIGRWQDIWLNEGFVTYAVWLWLERDNGTDGLNARADSEHEMAQVLAPALPPAGEPPPSNLFNQSVYQVGALTLHNLRLAVGDDMFFDTLRAYTARYGGAAATTHDFITVAEEISATDLSELFNAWLYADDIPAPPTD